ncbi:MAG TPA: hypothetical protein VM925_06715 [Labilithrix sp.]|nr:hypothetical protein [Labilithrix sp.]
MRVKGHVSAVVIAAALLFASAHAHAEPSLADRETARSLMDDGDKKREAGDLKGALESYRQADVLMSVPTTGIEVARTQVSLHQFLQARETLGRVIRLPVKPNEPAPFTAARRAAETLNAELAPRIPAVQVVITNLDPGVTPQVLVDDEQIPPAAVSAPRKVNPGPHVITVKAGTAELKQDVEVAERDNKTVTFDFKDQIPPPPPPQGGRSTSSKVLLFGGFGVALVGIGVGTVTGLMSLAKVSDLKPQCKNDICPSKLQGERDSAETLGNVSTIAFVAGGVGLAAGVVGLFASGSSPKKDPPSSSEAKVRRPASVFAPEHVRAVLGPSYVGVTGAF